MFPMIGKTQVQSVFNLFLNIIIQINSLLTNN